MPADVDHPYVEGRLGHRLYLDPADGRAVELLRSGGSFNRATLRVWDAALALDTWDVVVDVGANYGEMLLSTGLPEGARLVCFEPNPRVLPWLRRSIRESGLAVDLREVAVGATTSEATFVMDTVWSGRSGLFDTHRTDADHHLEPVVVPVRTLDSELALDEADRVCIKVDVEGAEFDVLEGARSVLSRRRRWAVMLEVLHMDGFEKARLADEFVMRVLDLRTGELVTVPPASARRVEELLGSGWVHPQDAVLTPKEDL